MTLYFVKKISFRNTKECFVAKIGPGLVINPTDGHTESWLLMAYHHPHIDKGDLSLKGSETR